MNNAPFTRVGNLTTEYTEHTEEDSEDWKKYVPPSKGMEN
jgi:hypothetical protein